MIKNFWFIVTREFKCLWHDKKALAIVVAMAFMYTIIFGYLYSPHTVKNLSTAVIDHSSTQLSRSVIEGFNKSDRFNIKYHLQKENEIEPLMAKGEIDAVIIIPQDFTRNIMKGQNSNLLLGVNASNMIISNGAAASALQIVKTYSAGVMVKKYKAKGYLTEQAINNASPINISFRPWFNPTYNYTNYLLLGIISIAIQQIFIMSVANSFVKEKEQGNLAKLLQGKRNFYFFITGKIAVYFFFALTSLIMAALLAFGVFHIPLRGSFLFILLMGIPFLLGVIFMGIFVAAFSNNRVEALQNAMLLAYPTFLLTGYTWPLIAMPQFLKNLAYCLPLTYFADNFRKIALMGIDFSLLQGDFYSLLIVTVIYGLLAVVVLRYTYLKEGFLSVGKKGKEC